MNANSDPVLLSLSRIFIPFNGNWSWTRKHWVGCWVWYVYNNMSENWKRWKKKKKGNILPPLYKLTRKNILCCKPLRLYFCKQPCLINLRPSCTKLSKPLISLCISQSWTRFSYNYNNMYQKKHLKDLINI